MSNDFAQFMSEMDGMPEMSRADYEDAQPLPPLEAYHGDITRSEHVDGAFVEPGRGEDKPAENWPTPLSDFDEENLPRREWIYGTDYIRKYVSVVASAGGIGKTSQAIAEGLSIVTGRALLGVDVKTPCNVWIINLEDPEEELRMRALAARKHYQIPREAIEGKLFLDGEDTMQMTLAVEGKNGIVTNGAFIKKMRDKIIENDIGVVIIDPFVSTHLVNENNNASIQAVVAMLRSLARQTRASISLVHHTRKGNGEDAGVDSVRGAGSLIGGCSGCEGHKPTERA